MNTALPLDHYALRVIDREAAVASYTRMGYEVVTSFELTLGDGSKAQSYALKHPEAPDVFVSSGKPGSKIHKWVMKRGGKGAVHHMAYAVDDVKEAMETWKSDGFEFDREEPLVCKCETPLIQVFTKEDPTTGLIYELISRGSHPGFCKENVARLMDGSPE